MITSIGNWFMAMGRGDILITYISWKSVSLQIDVPVTNIEILEFRSQTSPCMTEKLWIGTIKKFSIQSLNNWSCHIFRECKFNHRSNRFLGKLASECEVSRVIVYCFSCNGDLVLGNREFVLLLIRVRPSWIMFPIQ